MSTADAERGRQIAESGRYAPKSAAARNGRPGNNAPLPEGAGAFDLHDDLEADDFWAEEPHNGAEVVRLRPDAGADDPAGARLLNDVKAFLARYVVYPSDHELIAHTLWIAHTWLMECWESTPRIAYLSPEPNSGKTRALEVTEPLVPRPVLAVNTTSAYLFRKVSDPAGAPTILYDEIDTVFGPRAKDNEDIRGMLNAGHRKGATAGRCVVRGKVVETEELPAYCAVALAGLDDLPDTIMTRSVVVRMRRRSPTETVEPWRPRVTAAEADALRGVLIDWSNQVRGEAANMWPEMPAGVDDRNADVWEALIAVADLAGGHWPNTARVTAVTVVTASKGGTPSLGVTLLRDLRTVFNTVGAERLSTEAILTELRGIEESPWRVIRRGEPLDARGLSARLRKYGIGPEPQRVGADVFKGYSVFQLADAWSRYLDPGPVGPSPIEPVTSVTAVTAQVTDHGPAAGAGFVTDTTCDEAEQ